MARGALCGEWGTRPGYSVTLAAGSSLELLSALTSRFELRGFLDSQMATAVGIPGEMYSCPV